MGATTIRVLHVTKKGLGLIARSTWQDLPAAVSAAIERAAGPVAHAEIRLAGRNSDFSATRYIVRQHAGVLAAIKGGIPAKAEAAILRHIHAARDRLAVQSP